MNTWSEKGEKKRKQISKAAVCFGFFFADSFAGALLIRMRATATRQHQRKNADSLIIIFLLLFHFIFSLFIFLLLLMLLWWCGKIIERKEKRARDVNFLPFEDFFFMLFSSHSPFAKRSFLCDLIFMWTREKVLWRLNDHWDEVRKVSFVVSRRFKLRKKFIIQFANERKIKKKRRLVEKNVSLTSEILSAVIFRGLWRRWMWGMGGLFIIHPRLFILLLNRQKISMKKKHWKIKAFNYSLHPKTIRGIYSGFLDIFETPNIFNEKSDYKSSGFYSK